MLLHVNRRSKAVTGIDLGKRLLSVVSPNNDDDAFSFGR
jgi:hypothetical protein